MSSKIEKLLKQEEDIAKSIYSMIEGQLEYNLKALNTKVSDAVSTSSQKESFSNIGSHTIAGLSLEIQKQERRLSMAKLWLQSFSKIRNSLSEERRKVVVSGGFDPIHAGHIRMIKEAAHVGDVIVVVNSDDWLMRKKGYVFMPWEERAEIIKSIEGVVEVSSVDDSDGSVCEALERLKPELFANGGDRHDKNTPEKSVCESLGITMIWNVGGGKIQSSSDLVAALKDNKKKKK